MESQTIILIERKGGKEFIKFMELFKNRSEIPCKEIRAKISRSSYYEFVLNKVHKLNQTVKHLNPKLEHFITPTLNDKNGKVIEMFKRNCNIQIIDEDPNYFYLLIGKSAE